MRVVFLSWDYDSLWWVETCQPAREVIHFDTLQIAEKLVCLSRVFCTLCIPHLPFRSDLFRICAWYGFWLKLHAVTECRGFCTSWGRRLSELG